MTSTPILLGKCKTASCKSYKIVLQASVALALFLSVAGGCKQDPSIDALKKENATLRKQASARELPDQPNHIPLSDSGAPITAPPAGPAPHSTEVPADKVSGPPVNNKDFASTDKIVKDIDLPPYPNAQHDTVPGIPDTSVQSSGGVHLHLLVSNDSVDAIVAFYDEKMKRYVEDPTRVGSWIYRHPARRERKQDKNRVVTLSDVLADGTMRTVEIREDSGKTYIELMRIENPSSMPSSITPGVATPHPAGAAGTSGTTSPARDPLAPPPLLPGGPGQ